MTDTEASNWFRALDNETKVRLFCTVQEDNRFLRQALTTSQNQVHQRKKQNQFWTLNWKLERSVELSEFLLFVFGQKNFSIVMFAFGGLTKFK